ncbi:MAG: hypothetical protein K2W33_10555 [Burkholderiales bacterium]|nr:hypothetical protein [Burkholderiales bacterium]
MSLLSRSGRTDPAGKLTQRLDVPVTDDLHDRVVVAASSAGLPKAEFVRSLLSSALADGCWLPVSEKADRALDVLSALHDQKPGEYLLELVEEVILERFAMHQSIARGGVRMEVDQSPKFARGRG